MADQEEEQCLWYFHFHEQGCLHVQFVDRNDGTLQGLAQANQGPEDELLFTKGSPFEIIGGQWAAVPRKRSNPTVGSCHRIDVRVPRDCKDPGYPEHLPYAPWC